MDYVRVILNFAYMNANDQKKIGELTTENLINLTYVKNPGVETPKLKLMMSKFLGDKTD